MQRYSSPGNSITGLEWTQDLLEVLFEKMNIEMPQKWEAGSLNRGQMPISIMTVMSLHLPKVGSEVDGTEVAGDLHWDRGLCRRARASKSQAGQVPSPETPVESGLKAERTVGGY